MKKLAIGITILLIITLVITFYGYRFTINSAEDLINNLSKLERSIEESNWNQAQKDATELKKEWQKTGSIWPLLSNHTEIDRLDISILRVTKLVELENREKALVELTLTKRFVQHISENEIPIFINIF